MADFENLATIEARARRSERARRRRARVNLAPEDEYQVGKLVLAEYDFVPYALPGSPPPCKPRRTASRATTTVTVPLGDDQGGSASVEQTVTLFGPGDVVGIDPAQIIRRYPAPGSTNAEETFHAHVESTDRSSPGRSARIPPRTGSHHGSRSSSSSVTKWSGNPREPGSSRSFGRRRVPPTDRHRVGVGTRAGVGRVGLADRALVDRVRASQRVAPPRGASPHPEHELRGVHGPDDGGRAQHRARPGWGIARAGMDGAVGHRAATGVRPVGVPHRPRRRLRPPGASPGRRRRAMGDRAALHGGIAPRCALRRAGSRRARVGAR